MATDLPNLASLLPDGANSMLMETSGWRKDIAYFFHIYFRQNDQGQYDLQGKKWDIEPNQRRDNHLNEFPFELASTMNAHRDDAKMVNDLAAFVPPVIDSVERIATTPTYTNIDNLIRSSGIMVSVWYKDGKSRPPPPMLIEAMKRVTRYVHNNQKVWEEHGEEIQSKLGILDSWVEVCQDTNQKPEKILKGDSRVKRKFNWSAHDCFD